MPLTFFQVELRAFCSKHSEVDNGTSGQCTGDMLVPVGPDSKNQAVKPSADRIHKFGRRNGDKVAVNIEIDDLSVNADKMNNGVLHVDGLSDNRSNSEVQSELVDLQQHFNNGTSGVEATNDDDVSETMNLNMMVRKVLSIVHHLKSLCGGFYFFCRHVIIICLFLFSVN